MEKITSKIIKFIIAISIIVIFINVASASAYEIDNSTIHENNALLTSNGNQIENINAQQSVNPENDLYIVINNSKNNDKIILEKGTYKINDITLTKNITFQGNGNPRDIIIDGGNKSSIFLIRSPSVHVSFNNITFINGLTYDFGGAISMETGNVYVENCIFINNTALGDTNAGGISNYGNKTHKGYLYVNNSLFVNNHADHDGGAITTCYASSDIYNSVFISNSAHRDGGAIRVSVEGYGNVQDCIFMYNHADEWGGAYYSWAGESNIERCIFLNNTAGTNGGAVMVSGNLNLANSIIVNNTGERTGGSFYIQQPMFDETTVINVHDNLITNNTSPYGKEIFIKWKDIKHLFTRFNNNDWGEEDPNDSSVIDPDNVTKRSKVTSTIKSDLLDKMDLSLLNRYSDLIGSYFPSGYLNQFKNKATDIKEPSEKLNRTKDSDMTNNNAKNVENSIITSNVVNSSNANANSHQEAESNYSNNAGTNENLVSPGENNKAYELDKKDSASKQVSPHFEYFIAIAVIAFLALLVGYKRSSGE